MADAPSLFLLFEKDQACLASEFDAFLAESTVISDYWRDVRGAAIANLHFNGIGFQCHQWDFNPLWADFKTVFANPDWSKLRSCLAINLGGHVDAGRISPSIVKHLLALSVALGEKLDCEAVVWNPAQIVSGFGYFSEAVEQYQRGGPFPVLALVDFLIANDGSLSTAGLSWFAGQELAFEASKLSAVEQMRRAVRISHDIACNGIIDVKLEMDGLDVGERLSLVPSGDGQKLVVSISSKMDQ